jgi:hypothetical protein
MNTTFWLGLQEILMPILMLAGMIASLGIFILDVEKTEKEIRRRNIP